MKKERQHIQAFDWVLMLLGGLALLFIIAPLLSMVLASSGTELFNTLQSKEVNRSIWLTLKMSFLAVLIFSVGAIPLAYLLARRNFPLKRLVSGMVDLPVVIPHSAAGIALLSLVSKQTTVGRFVSWLGLDFVSQPAGISLAMAFVSLPFLINAARDGFLAVPRRLEQAALNLGASPVRVFFSISLPLAWRSIVSGFVLMFARGMSEFGAVVIIAYHPMITPVLIFERFNAFGLKYARPVAIIFIAACLIVFVLLRLLVKNRKHAQS